MDCPSHHVFRSTSWKFYPDSHSTLKYKKGDLSAAEYYQKMTGFANTMANIGQPMNDEEVIGYILT